MFTGLIEEIGRIDKIIPNKEGRGLQIDSNIVIEDIKLGDSVSVDGVCLSVTGIGNKNFKVQAVQETLQRSTLQNIKTGAPVNLERAMLPTSRFGGHFVQGHVDAIGKILSWEMTGQSALLKILAPDKVMKYIVEKGSITINGISLTVAALEESMLSIALIPITLKETNLGQKKVGDHVNIEVDTIAKYVENLLEKRSSSIPITEKMKKWGYGN